MKTKAKPPNDLSKEAAKLWLNIAAESDMDVAGNILLNEICRLFDRLREARTLIREQGLVVTETTAAGHAKRRPHPACQIEATASAGLMRAWRLLGFDQLPPGGI